MPPLLHETNPTMALTDVISLRKQLKASPVVEVHLQTDLDLNYYPDDDYSNPKFDQIQVGARFLTVLELEEGVQSASIQSPDLKAFPHFSYNKSIKKNSVPESKKLTRS